MEKLKLFFFLLFFTIVSYSQNDTSKIYTLSEVVVSATKTSASIVELANSITVIDSAEIQRKKKNNVLDLLKSEYGVSVVQQGAFGSLANVFTRGAGSGHTLILIDGVEVNMPNDPAGTFDFANLQTDNIERIEILRGPQSTLYGSDALAGVINIISKKGIGKPKYYLSTEGGSYNTYKGLLGLNGSYDMLNYSLSLSRYKTDGFSSSSGADDLEKDGASSYSTSAKIGANIFSNLNLNFILRFTKADVDYDQFGGKFGDDPTYVFNLEETALRGEIKYSSFNGFMESIVGISHFRNLRKYSNDAFVNDASRAFYDGRKLKIDLQNNFYFFPGNTLTLGIESEKEKAESEYYVYSTTFPFSSVLPLKSSLTNAVYLQDQFRVGDFFASAGIRFDDHQKFGSAITYRFAPAYLIWETGTKFKATVGTGFKAPSLYYLFDPSFGNTELDPEKSFGWDAGIEQYFADGSGSIGLTYFRNTFDDLFGFDENFKTINIDKAESSGIEFFFTANPFNNVQFKSSYTYTKSINKSEDSKDFNKQLLRRPKYKITSSINYSFSNGLNLNTEIIFIGQREDMDFGIFPAQRVKLKSYTLVNFTASYDILYAIQLFGRVDNLFDAEYEEVLGYATPGLSGYAGVKLSF